MYTCQGKNCSVCEMLQPFQQQGASFKTHACRQGDHGIPSNGDKPLAVCDTLRGSAPTQGPPGRRVAVPTPAWVPALEAVAVCRLHAQPWQPFPARVTSQKGGAVPVPAINTTTAHWVGGKPAG